jgi:cytochrome P450
MNLTMGSIARDSVAYIEYANGHVDSRIEAYKTNPSSDEDSPRKDFTYYLLRARDPVTSTGLTTAELHADSALLMHAGSDTTSIAMSSCIFYLLHNLHTLAALNDEIRTIFSSAEDIHSGPTLNSCTYLRACIDEALRLSPPVPSHLPREVLPGGLTVDGHWFLPGTVVGTSPWAIHHNAEYFPDPFTFQPERWIAKDNNAEAVAVARSAFCAFSLGSRGCVGKSVAYVEVSLALANLLWRYDISLGEGQPTGGGTNVAPAGWRGRTPKGKSLPKERNREDEYQLFDHFTADRDGPMVKFRKRVIG